MHTHGAQECTSGGLDLSFGFGDVAGDLIICHANQGSQEIALPQIGATPDESVIAPGRRYTVRRLGDQQVTVTPYDQQTIDAGTGAYTLTGDSATFQAVQFAGGTFGWVRIGA